MRFTYFAAATQLCAGNYSGGVDTCQGDSGGPVLASLSDGSGGGYPGVQIGITSYGDGCAQPGRVSVYTRVSAFAPWLAQQLGAPLPSFADAAPSPPPGVGPELLPAPGAVVCGEAWSNSSSPLVAAYPALLDCGSLTVIAVTYAYYGNPTGDCFTAQPGGCNSAGALAVALRACIGRNSCRLVRVVGGCGARARTRCAPALP